MPERTSAWGRATLYLMGGLFDEIERHELRNAVCLRLSGTGREGQWHLAGTPRRKHKHWQTEVSWPSAVRPGVAMILPGWDHMWPTERSALSLESPECAWYPSGALENGQLRYLYEFRRALCGYVAGHGLQFGFDHYEGPPFELVGYQLSPVEVLFRVGDYREAIREAMAWAIDRRGTVEIAEGRRTVATVTPKEHSARGWEIGYYRFAQEWPERLVAGGSAGRVGYPETIGDGRLKTTVVPST